MKFISSNNLTYVLSTLKTNNDALYAPKSHIHEQYLTKTEGFSGDYNDLTNRPCYEEYELITHTFDGNTDGKITVAGQGALESYVKISDDVDSIQYDLIEASKVKYVTTHSDGEIVETQANYVELLEEFDGEVGAISIDTAIYIILKDGFETEMLFEPVTFPEKGIYVAVKNGYTSYYTSSISLPISTVKQLDEKFIPDTIARADELLELGTTWLTAYRGDLGDIAYNHSKADHAPADAQKNSDITKAEIEAKLTGAITSHTHTSVNGYSVWVGTQSEYDAIASKSSTTLYFIK